MLPSRSSHETSQPENDNKEKKPGLFNTKYPMGKMEKLPEFRYRWNSNEEVFSILTSLEEHEKWVEDEVKIRPPNGSLLLYNRGNFKTRAYHNDKYHWKTRKNCNSSRVDHSSLRIRGVECIYCSYVHSALVPTFHRRCYWLLKNPDIVLVHYLNLPDNKTSQEQLITSLLPYKDLHEKELFNQLQPILSHSDDIEDNYQKMMDINITQLITDVKSSITKPKPKSNGRKSGKKLPPVTNPPVTSAEIRHPIPTRTVTSQDTEKCSNCNRHLNVTTTSLDPTLNTNVAVTINRPTNSQRRTQTSVSSTGRNHVTQSQGFTTSPLSEDSVDPKYFITGANTQGPGNQAKDINNNIIPATISLTGYQDFAGSLMMTSPITSQIPMSSKSSQLPLSSHVPSRIQSSVTSRIPVTSVTSSRSSHQPFSPHVPVTLQASMTSQVPVTSMTSGSSQPPIRSQIPMTSQILMTSQPSATLHKSVTSPLYMTSDINKQNGENLVLDYDGMNLIQSNYSDNDAAKLFAMNLFDSELLQYLPDFISDVNCLTSEVPTTSTDVTSVSFPTSPKNRPQSESNRATSTSFSSCTNSNHHGQQSFMPTPHNFHGNLLDTTSSFVDMIYSDCHSPARLSPVRTELIRPPADNVLTPAVSTQQCTSVASVPASSSLKENTVVNLPHSESGLKSVTTTLVTSVAHDKHTQPLDGGLPRDFESPGDQQKDTITEFSPEWSYCDGKTKVLILGPWSYQAGSYSCLFDGCSVPASLIQPGVLRCFCPPHDPGQVVLQVAWNGFIVSNACAFQYKARENSTNSVQDWLSVSDVDVRKLILERIERLEASLHIAAPGDGEDTGGIIMDIGRTNEGSVVTTGDSLQDRIVRICSVIFEKQCDLSVLKSSSKKLSLLHLAAALGFSKLIQLLRHCSESRTYSRTGNEGGNDTLWDPQSRDIFGCTPLMWACWRGHVDAALVLLAWEPSTYDDCDNNGRSAKDLAQEMRHLKLVAKMEEFVHSQNKSSFSMSNMSCPLSPSTLSVAYPPFYGQVPVSPMSDQTLTWERVEGDSEDFVDCEMASVTSEDRPNTLGKVLVEIRTLIQEAEKRAKSSSVLSPDESTPFSVSFTGLPELPYDDVTEPSDSKLGLRTSHYDALSVTSSSPSHSPSWSPGSPSIRNSPQSTSTDTSEFEEFLNKPRKFLERDFSELTLTDVEQQELLQAAKVIQNAYRQFKIRKKQHVDELKAAVLIQSYYRRYKQFALYRKITKAAVLIQNSYRAHKEHEQFKRSRHAAAIIQNYFRHYRKRKQRHTEEEAPGKRMETKYRKPSHGK